jgi:hypothetical protein
VTTSNVLFGGRSIVHYTRWEKALVGRRIVDSRRRESRRRGPLPSSYGHKDEMARKYCAPFRGQTHTAKEERVPTCQTWKHAQICLFIQSLPPCIS